MPEKVGAEVVWTRLFRQQRAAQLRTIHPDKYAMIIFRLHESYEGTCEQRVQAESQCWL